MFSSCIQDDLSILSTNGNQLNNSITDYSYSASNHGEIVNMNLSNGNTFAYLRKNGKNYYQGDMILTDKQIEIIERNIPSTYLNPGYDPYVTLWDNAIVNYIIVGGTQQQKELVRTSLQKITEVSNILFVEGLVNTGTVQISISNSGGCSSYVGKTGYLQALNLGPGCDIEGIIIHEMFHALGVNHEQCRRDRDDYIDVFYDNIEPYLAYNFDKSPYEVNYELSGTYDYNSVMHYYSGAFSKNGQSTILKKNGESIPYIYYMSEQDKEKIRKLYEGEVANRGDGGSIKPSIRLESPAEFTFYSLDPIRIKYSSSDVDGTVTSQKIIIDSDTLFTNEYLFTPLYFGTYSVKIIVSDNDQNVTETSFNLEFVNHEGSSCNGIPLWDSGETYTSGDKVLYNGFIWTAAHWTRGNEPSDTNPYGPWRDKTTCN